MGKTHKLFLPFPPTGKRLYADAIFIATLIVHSIWRKRGITYRQTPH